MANNPAAFIAPGVYRTPAVDPKTGHLSWAFIQELQRAGAQLNAPANTVPPPVTSGASGQVGQIAFDADFLYVATGKNTWKRIALTAF